MTAAQKQLTNATDSNWTCVSQGRALTLLLLFLPPLSLAAAAAVCYYDDEIQLGSPPVQLQLLLSNQLCVRWMGVWRCFYSRSGATGRVSEFRIQKKTVGQEEGQFERHALGFCVGLLLLLRLTWTCRGAGATLSILEGFFYHFNLYRALVALCVTQQCRFSHSNISLMATDNERGKERRTLTVKRDSLFRRALVSKKKEKILFERTQRP